MKWGKYKPSDQSPELKVKKYYVARIRVSSLRPGFDYSLSEKIQGWGFQSLKIDDAKKWFSAEVPRDGSVTFIVEHEKDNSSGAGTFRLNKINNLNGGGATLIDFGLLYIAGSVNATGIKNAMEFCGNGNEHLSWEIIGSSEPLPIVASVKVPSPGNGILVHHQGLPPTSPKVELPRFNSATVPTIPVVLKETTPVPSPEAVLKAAQEEAPVIPKTEEKVAVEPVNGAAQPQETQANKLQQTKPKSKGKKMKQKKSNPVLLAHVRNACLKRFNISSAEFKGEPAGVMARQVFCYLIVNELEQGGGADARAEIGAPDTSGSAVYNNATAGKKHLAADKDLRKWADDLVDEAKEKFKDDSNGSTEASPVKPKLDAPRQKGPRAQKSSTANAKPAAKPPKSDGVTDHIDRIQDQVIFAVQQKTKCSIDDLAKVLGAEQDDVSASLGRGLVEAGNNPDNTEKIEELLSTINALNEFLSTK